MTTLLAILKDLQAKYIKRVLKAPAYGGYAFGVRSDSKKDIRKAYIADLKNMMEVAKQNGDEKAMDFIKGAVQDDDDELEADIAAIKGTKVK